MLFRSDARDMDITPTMGIVEVRKVKQNVSVKGLDELIVFPNPNEGQINVKFKVDTDGDVTLDVKDLVGKEVLSILNTKMPSGEYFYQVELNELANGMYIMSLQTSTSTKSNKIFINK